MEEASFQARACSLPPPPTTKTLICVAFHTCITAESQARHSDVTKFRTRALSLTACAALPCQSCRPLFAACKAIYGRHDDRGYGKRTKLSFLEDKHVPQASSTDPCVAVCMQAEPCPSMTETAVNKTLRQSGSLPVNMAFPKQISASTLALQSKQPQSKAKSSDSSISQEPGGDPCGDFQHGLQNPENRILTWLALLQSGALQLTID